MTASFALAVLYLLQLWLKASLALITRAREPRPPRADLSRVTVMQPVTSGDPRLGEFLGSNIETLEGARFLWILDRNDLEADVVCRSLITRHPTKRIEILYTDEPAPACNPKLWKQCAAFPRIETEIVAIIDDDTRVPRESIDCLVAAVDGGAEIATGLPSYVAARGVWSALVAEFVNSAAILTYLPAAACAEPLSINGMCYAMRTSYVREHRLFDVCLRAITDDLAIAKEVHRLGGHIVQTTRSHEISTTVASAAHYGGLMHRWFVFSRLLVQNETPVREALIIVSYGLNPILLAGLVFCAIVQPSTLWMLAVVLTARAATLALLNRRFTGRWRHAPLASVFAELIQPLFLIGAIARPVIRWRHRKILVRKFDDFEYLAP